MKESRTQTAERAIQIIKILRSATKGMEKTASLQIIARYGRDPLLILISCLLSLRTKDITTFPASCRLFAKARTLKSLLKLPIKTIESLIYPVGFYKTKAKSIHSVCKDLLERFDGQVPSSRQELLSIKGIGPKTANLVLGDAFGIPALVVDTHVHKISNRLGLVKTKTPEETEKALTQLLPKRYWIEFGQLMVMWGQNICVPVSPKCSECAISALCPKVGVTRSR